MEITLKAASYEEVWGFSWLKQEKDTDLGSHIRGLYYKAGSTYPGCLGYLAKLTQTMEISLSGTATLAINSVSHLGFSHSRWMHVIGDDITWPITITLINLSPIWCTICWGSSIRASNLKKLNKLIKKAGSVLWTALESLKLIDN